MQEDLLAIRRELHFRALEHVIFSSPVLIVTIIPVIAWSLLSRISVAFPRFVIAWARGLAKSMDFDAVVSAENLPVRIDGNVSAGA